eukprot:jgi/Bigna1/86228/estExt_fgenesh1_pg.C_90050
MTAISHAAHTDFYRQKQSRDRPRLSNITGIRRYYRVICTVVTGCWQQGLRKFSSSTESADLPTELAVLTTIMNAEKAATVDEAFQYFDSDALVIRPSGSPIEAENPDDWTSAILKLWGMTEMSSRVHGVDSVVETADEAATAFYTVEQNFEHNGNTVSTTIKFRSDLIKDPSRGWVISKIERSSKGD